jgi:hypothetical protein
MKFTSFIEFLKFSKILKIGQLGPTVRVSLITETIQKNIKNLTKGLIRFKRIYNFLCSMLVYTPFALCFVTLRGVFMHFPKLTY